VSLFGTESFYEALTVNANKRPINRNKCFLENIKKFFSKSKLLVCIMSEITKRSGNFSQFQTALLKLVFDE
jgi:hypothetical protein